MTTAMIFRILGALEAWDTKVKAEYHKDFDMIAIYDNDEKVLACVSYKRMEDKYVVVGQTIGSMSFDSLKEMCQSLYICDILDPLDNSEI